MFLQGIGKFYRQPWRKIPLIEGAEGQPNLKNRDLRINQRKIFWKPDQGSQQLYLIQ